MCQYHPHIFEKDKEYFNIYNLMKKKDQCETLWGKQNYTGQVSTCGPSCKIHREVFPKRTCLTQKNFKTKRKQKSARVLLLLIYPSPESLKFTPRNLEKITSGNMLITRVTRHNSKPSSKRHSLNSLGNVISYSTMLLAALFHYFPCTALYGANWKAAPLPELAFTLPALTTQQAASSRNVQLSSSCHSTPYKPPNDVPLPAGKSKLQLS